MLIQSDFAIPPVKAEITQHLKYDIAMGVDPKEFELGCSKKNLFLCAKFWTEYNKKHGGFLTSCQKPSDCDIDLNFLHVIYKT